MKAKKSVSKTKKSVMKAKPAMKAMKAAKRVSKIAKGKRAKSAVLSGRKEKTVGGLKKSDLRRNKSGKVVSIKASNRGKKNKWAQACAQARKALGIKGFCAFGGKSKQGQDLLKKARSIYKK